MPGLLSAVLKQHFETTLYREPQHFVFCRADGSPLDPDHMRNCVLYPAMDKANIERQKRGSGLHMFRYLAGSVVYAVTGDIMKAQEQLGHSDLQTTSNIYVHSNLTQKQEAAKALELTFAADLLSTLLPEKNYLIAGEGFEPPTFGL